MKHTNDKTDTFWLAHLLRLGLLPEGYIYPKEKRGLRELLRQRSHTKCKEVMSLKGNYWTSRKTTGTIELSFLSKKRLEHFPISDEEPHPVSITD